MFRSFSLRVLFITFFTLVLTGLPFAFLFTHLHRKTVIRSLQVNNQNLMRILVNQLERFMMIQQPHLTEDYLLDMVAQTNAEKVMIMKKEGKVTYSSDPLFIGRHFQEDSPLCLSCHENTPPPEQNAVLWTEEGGRELLRLVSIVPNRSACHNCHSPQNSYLGIITMDIPIASVMGEMKTSQIQILAVGLWMLLVTLIVLTLVLEKRVVSPIKETVRYLESLSESEKTQPPERLLRMPLIEKVVRAISEKYTEVLSHKREIQDNKNFLRNVLDSLKDEIAVIDRSRRIILANRTFEENVPPGKRDPICLRESGECLALKSLQSGAMLNCTLNEADRVYQITTIPLPEKDLVIEVRRDITGIREMENKLMQSERLTILGFLAASVAHQLNTPLATLSALVEASERDDRIATHRISKMGTALNRLKEMGRQLLFLSTAPEEKEQEIDVGQILERCIRIIEEDFHLQNILATISIPQKNICMKGYPLQIEQIFLNILMNAMQAMPEGGSLTVSLALQQDQVLVTITDTGMGIKEEDLERIFHPTFTTKGPRGTGFGLFLVKNFVENMAGQVIIRSQVGKGTDVLLSFPGGYHG